ncbi:DUF6141 family protein [Albibacterium bauzanense]|uniref:PH (Pleckstrin Homology) domain-containing protein n=1 Tax=Albibacterium bauzanense TaxID=653929 RepID=A0A4R1M0E8_9SPHI|nr:DUF6141 family protein [Albibacterium bauzanense]TCK85085.1 hypothetical protein C8N28_0382 [Albibacterium bauzanense]
MNDKVLFSEQQRFRQWWFWLILLGINTLFILGAYKQVIERQQFGDKPMSNEGLIFATGLVVLFTVLFVFARLETQVKNDGIYIRFFPFHISFKYYPWDKITRSFVRKYRPLVEYGGWGLRFSIFGSGTAYNVSGNMGLQLQFTDQKKLLIGTSSPEELIKALNEINQFKS